MKFVAGAISAVVFTVLVVGGLYWAYTNDLHGSGCEYRNVKVASPDGSPLTVHACVVTESKPSPEPPETTTPNPTEDGGSDGSGGGSGSGDTGSGSGNSDGSSDGSGGTADSPSSGL